MINLSHISTNIDRVRNEIGEAATRAGRKPEDVTLVAVTKTYGADHVAAAVHAGVTNAGENRVQEAVPKIDAVGNDLSLSPLRWHLIGHLQSNKARQAVQYFDMIHSLDSVRLATEINRHAIEADKLMSILMQVNISKEESKSGFSAGQAEESLVTILETCPNLVVQGFMTMAPFAGPEEARPVFKELRELRDSISKKISDARFNPTELSMGMTGDFELAIEEGSTMVRVGSGIFGVHN